MKNLLLITALLVSPMVATAQVSSENRQSACEAFSEMTKLTATFRDAGLTASDSYVQMVNSGLSENVALTIVKIVYDQAPTQSPDSIAGVSYIACMEATKQ